MISGVMSAAYDPSTVPTPSPVPSRSAGCVGGLHEACVGVTDLEEAIAEMFTQHSQANAAKQSDQSDSA